eukprot:1931312-Alexandrium_andersonii.AAC.1
MDMVTHIRKDSSPEDMGDPAKRRPGDAPEFLPDKEPRTVGLASKVAQELNPRHTWFLLGPSERHE